MRTKLKRKPKGLTAGAKTLLAAFSMLGFIGGWNAIARLEWQDVQADEPSQPTITPTSTSIRPTPTPWPTIPPLAKIPPIPTLSPALITVGQAANPVQAGLPDSGPGVGEANAFVQTAPLPTPAPLPTLAPLPPMPELLPPPPPHPGE